MNRSLTARKSHVATATRRKSASSETASVKSLSADIAPAIELLKKLATYELEAGVDRFMLDLGEKKESLNGGKSGTKRRLQATATILRARYLDIYTILLNIKRNKMFTTHSKVYNTRISHFVH